MIDALQTDTCPWQVICVFDPDGTGGDFGYTVGLSVLGVPELHMWARPTHGVDPGLDFKLSMHDVGLVLNTQAERLLAGELRTGERFSVDLDGGLARAEFTAAEPCDRLELDAFQVHPRAQVVTLRWELHRTPVRPATPVPEDVRREVNLLTRHWTAVGATQRGTEGILLDEPDADLGPWAPAIQAVRACVGKVAAAGMGGWLANDVSERLTDLRGAFLRGSHEARAHGRTASFDLAGSLGRVDGARVVTENDDLFADCDRAEVERVLPAARRGAQEVLSSCYSLMVVREFMDADANSIVLDKLEKLCVELAEPA